MTKKDFDAKLSAALKNADSKEKAKLLDYYNELYLDKFENGFREDIIINGFGDPEEIAIAFMTEVRETSLADEFVQKGKTKAKAAMQSFAKKPIFKSKGFWIFYFSAFIITFPLTIALFSVGIGLLSAALGIAIGLLAVVFSVYIVALACLLGGVAGLVPTVMAFIKSVPVGLVNLACCFAVFGIGLFAFVISKKITAFLVKVFKKEKRYAENA